MQMPPRTVPATPVAIRMKYRLGTHSPSTKRKTIGNTTRPGGVEIATNQPISGPSQSPIALAYQSHNNAPAPNATTHPAIPKARAIVVIFMSAGRLNVLDRHEVSASPLSAGPNCAKVQHSEKRSEARRVVPTSGGVGKDTQSTGEVPDYPCKTRVRGQDYQAPLPNPCVHRGSRAELQDIVWL